MDQSINRPNNKTLSQSIHLSIFQSTKYLPIVSAGIRINAINPTYVPTRVLRDASDMIKMIEPVMGKVFENEAPLQGQTSGAEEQAEVILFLASDAARMVHGQCIIVDAGISLKGNPFNYPPVYMKYLNIPDKA